MFFIEKRFFNKSMYIILYMIFIAFVLGSCTDGLKLDEPCKVLDPADVKEGMKYKDCDGNEKVGTMLSLSTEGQVDGSKYSVCNESNQKDCIASSESGFKSIKLSDIDPNSIKSGTNVLGVEGRLPECDSENEIDCITNTRYKSIDKDNIPYESLLSSVSILGRNGDISLCNAGNTNCYINTDTFKAAESSSLIASNIKMGVSIGGVEGTYGYSNCNSDTHTGCLAVSDYPSVEPSVISNYLLSSVDLSAYGLSGSVETCDGDTFKSNCYVNGENSILAINKTNITAGNIKSGVTIGDITGAYPQVSAANESKVRLTSSVFSNIGSLTYPAGTEFVWFDKNGEERTGTVPSNLVANNIKKDFGVFGVRGEYNGGIPKVFNNGNAFAILNPDGSVTSWGDSSYGGIQQYYDSSESRYVDVSSSLTSGVVNIFHNHFAFVALKEDGSVVTWGDSSYGGNSSHPVGGSLSSGVIKIYSTVYAAAFAALKKDGSVVTWGDPERGGDFNNSDGATAAPTDSLSSGVVEIYSTGSAFAALKSDGSVVTWGSTSSGGNSSGVDLSSDVVRIYSTNGAFAALKSNKSVVVWGNSSEGGNAGGVDLSSGVERIYSTNGAFAALKTGGSVVVWGNSSYGGDAGGVDLSSDVEEIYSNENTFVAIKTGGSVVRWGAHSIESPVGGDLSSGVERIYSNYYAFAALKSNGSVVTWGYSNYGGDSSTSTGGDLSSDVVDIVSNNNAFAALKNDGSVVTWGDQNYGGNFTHSEEYYVSAAPLNSLSSGVVKIVSTNAAFAALKSDGTVITWGNESYGGNSSDNTYILDHTGSSSLTNIIDIKGGNYGSFVGIRADGTYISWGSYPP